MPAVVARHRALLGALLACWLLPAAAGHAQGPTPMTPYAIPEFGFAVALPTACRHQRGPGTLEAICDLMLDAELSREVPAATALILEVGAEAVAADAAAFGEAELRAELPANVCGESEAARVKIAPVAASNLDGATILDTEVVCPPIRFLRLPERKALVQVVVAPGLRHRLMVRAPSADLDRLRPVAAAFIASFKRIAERAP